MFDVSMIYEWLERWLHDQEYLELLKRTGVWFSAPT